MKISLVSIGDELLSGRTLNSNSRWLAHQLNSLGHQVVLGLTVPDIHVRIIESIEIAADKSDIVITTGGLGPTVDDRTREAFAEFVGADLKLNRELLSTLEKNFADRNIRMPKHVRREAMIPDGAITLHNSVGVAPGLYIQTENGTHLIALPGVPGEMKAIFEESLKPILLDLSGERPVGIESFYTTGIPESPLYKIVADSLGEPNMDNLAFYPSTLGVEVRIKIFDTPEDRNVLATLRSATEPWCYTRKEKSLPSILGNILTARNATLSTAESCTGGLIATRIVDIPGASKWFEGGAVVYSNRAKNSVLGLPNEILEQWGAVSPQVAAILADNAATRFNTDYALSTTGIAGPSGGTEEKPVGLVYYGVHTPKLTIVRKNRFTGGREYHRMHTSQAALHLLWLILENKYKEHPWADGSVETLHK